jgi:hypothetical protein
MSNISKPASIRNGRAPSSTIERGVVSLRSPDAMQHVSAASLIRGPVTTHVNRPRRTKPNGLMRGARGTPLPLK